MHRRTTSRQKPSDDSGRQKHTLSPAAKSFFRALAAEDLVGEIEERLGAMGPRLFDGVNAESRPNKAYDLARWSAWAPTMHAGAVHLELGVWTAWPAERVDRYVHSERIGDLIRLDYEIGYPVDIAASATALPFASNSIDRLSSNSLFEHVLHAEDIVFESFRVLKPGGLFDVTVPFHFVQHGCPNDYLRFTGEYFKEMCREAGFEIVEIDTTSASGVFYTLHNLAKASGVDPSLKHRDRSRFDSARRSAIEILAALSVHDDKILGGGIDHYHSTRAFAVKPGEYVRRENPVDRTVPFLQRHGSSLLCPKTWTPLRVEGDTLVSEAGARYEVIDGKPDLRVDYGRGSRRGLLDQISELQKRLESAPESAD